ncbi:MAG: outer membrane protein assembly factor BamA [Planctomycetes bacterium]|nr:outer membrane protein assembly factor BamA [Planctomycetota bacterium]
MKGRASYYFHVALTVWFSLFSILPARLVLGEQEVEVKDVVLQGLRKTDPMFVTSRLQTKKSKPYSKEVVQNDIHRLYASGLFADIDLREEAFEGGVRLTFIFQENEVLEDITFQGIKALTERDVKKDLRLKVGETFSQYYLRLDIESIKEKYVAKGHQFADVQHRTKPGKTGILLEYVVREGPRVTVDRIHFKGNDGLGDGALDGVMKTKENVWYLSHAFSEKELEDDLERIKLLYRSEGWLDAQVFKEDVEFNADRTEVEIWIRVAEGQRYRVKEIKVSGNKLFSTQEIIDAMKTKPGTDYVGRVLDRDLTVVRDLYGDKAYTDADIKVDTPLAEEPGQVYVTFSITENSKTYLEKVTIQGNTKTRDKVIRRVLDVYPGEEFNMRRLKRSLSRLESSGYFQDVSFRTEEGSDPEHRNLILDLKEGSTGALRLGGGFSSNFGVIGLLELSQRNFDIADPPKSLDDAISGNAFAGAGQFFRISAQPGANRSRFGIDFREPWFLGEPLGFSVSAFYFQKRQFFFDEERFGGSIGVDKRFDDVDGLVVGLTFRGEHIEILNVDDDAPEAANDVAGGSNLLALEPSAELDRRDSSIFPTTGYDIRLNTTIAGLGGDFHFLRADLIAEKFFTLYTTPSDGKHVLGFVTRAGIVGAYGPDKDVPIFERYFAGGVGSARGFKFRSISPKDATGQQEGGDALFATTGEYSLPLYRTDMRGRDIDILRGAVWLDMANVEHNWAQFEPRHIRMSVGFGIRFSVPQLGQVPIAIDIGFPLRKEDGDETQLVQLNLGSYF